MYKFLYLTLFQKLLSVQVNAYIFTLITFLSNSVLLTGNSLLGKTNLGMFYGIFEAKVPPKVAVF